MCDILRFETLAGGQEGWFSLTFKPQNKEGYIGGVEGELVALVVLVVAPLTPRWAKG